MSFGVTKICQSISVLDFLELNPEGKLGVPSLPQGMVLFLYFCLAIFAHPVRSVILLMGVFISSPFILIFVQLVFFRMFLLSTQNALSIPWSILLPNHIHAELSVRALAIDDDSIGSASCPFSYFQIGRLG